MIYLELLAGLILLVVGAEALVRGSVRVARHLGVSPLMIGLTLVGFGTSSPELVASITAALRDSPGIAVGNVVGSNICNILLILGVSAVISPIVVARKAFARDGSVLLAASLAVLAISLYGYLPRLVGAVFVAALIAYLAYCYKAERQSGSEESHAHDGEAVAAPAGGGGAPMAIGLAASALGLTLLIGGAYLLVEGALALARGYGVSETLLGLTVVAVGTSLPELATSALAAWRGQSDVAFGNVVGSCIFNGLGILGVTALIRPIPVPTEIASVDIWVMMASSLVLVVFSFTGRRLSRGEGAAMLGLYGGYLGLLAFLG
ncbi:MAG: calcium/sodium antiporter [Rhodospirillales bacterium]